MLGVLAAQAALDLGVSLEQGTLALLELADVRETRFGRGQGAEEELEQELASNPRGPEARSGGEG